MKIKPIILFCILCFSTITIFGNQTEEFSKIEKLEKLSSIESNHETLEKICNYIESNWNDLMNNNSSMNQSSYILITFEDSFITVHPEALEVCIFLNGHTKNLGCGFFKRVVKGLAYSREKEVAVAFPKNSLIDQFFNKDINKDFFSEWSTLDSSSDNFTTYYDSIFDFNNEHDYSSSFDWTSLYSAIDLSDDSDVIDFDFTSSDLNMNSNYLDDLLPPIKNHWKIEQELNEIKMLMKAQSCTAVTKLFFISFPTLNKIDQSPIIVQQFYNGGSLNQYLSKKNLTNPEKLLIYHDTLMALSDIHDLNIIHNDLHLGNILVQEDVFTQKIDEVVIGDFGISREIDPRSPMTFIQKNQDLFMLLENLSTYLYFENEELRFFIFDLFLKNYHDTPTRQIFNEFTEELKKYVTEEEYNYITKNAIEKRPLKYKNGNTIIWH